MKKERAAQGNPQTTVFIDPKETFALKRLFVMIECSYIWAIK
jgi:hypothetical protein